MKEILIKELVRKYGASMSTKDMGKEIKSSYSKVSKLLSTYSEQEIRQKNILPLWKYAGKTRIWPVIEVVNWIYDTEDKS